MLEGIIFQECRKDYLNISFWLSLGKEENGTLSQMELYTKAKLM